MRLTRELRLSILTVKKGIFCLHRPRHSICVQIFLILLSFIIFYIYNTSTNLHKISNAEDFGTLRKNSLFLAAH